MFNRSATPQESRNAATAARYSVSVFLPGNLLPLYNEMEKYINKYTNKSPMDYITSINTIKNSGNYVLSFLPYKMVRVNQPYAQQVIDVINLHLKIKTKEELEDKINSRAI